ncbi:hypothetical protein HMPREF0428_01621 [Gemella haemolysans M341]|uniref:Uncharacterized protein n=1 Tax=Gemella haemolysans M341 TaxID=562981 RepID=A0AA87AKJ9_9BACL|nr:hypothetical protein HMPREF0428_01621 [Gemella haemolysans M341]
MKSIKCKKLYCLFAFLEIILLVMISGWYYFSERKMGMIRHILFRNVYKFPKYFTDTNVKLLIAIFVVFLIIQLLLLIRTRKYLFSFILNTLFIGLSIYFILNNNSDKVFIYYYLVMFFGLFNLIRFLQFLTLNHRVEK